jgi:SagB-type dehydrogenase family enzyme
MKEQADFRETLENESPSVLFHEASKLRVSDTTLGKTVWSVNSSPQIRSIISCPVTKYRGVQQHKFSDVERDSQSSLGTVLNSRRSSRNFNESAISISDITSLLVGSCGVTKSAADESGAIWNLRSYPSGGALFPIDLYCFVLQKKELDVGLYSYDAVSNTLDKVDNFSHIEELATATFQLEAVKKSAIFVILVANFHRTKFKYGERGYRFALLEAGHIAQNILLVAEDLKLGSLPVGGFVDDQLNEILGLDGVDRAAVYAVAIGQIDRLAKDN